jgi:hypothetical protein
VSKAKAKTPRPTRGTLDDEDNLKYPPGCRLPRELRPLWSCPVCGKKLVRTSNQGPYPGGWVCPAGHRGVINDGIVKRVFEERLPALLKSRRLTPFWTVARVWWRLRQQQQIDYGYEVNWK